VLYQPDKPEKIVRPTVLQWLRYTYVGSVPARNRAWVLHDTTTRTWLLRHVVRYLILVAPLVIGVMVFLPASVGLRAMSCLAAGLPMMMFYLAYTVEDTERRVEKAGYPHGTASRLREQRAIDAQRAVAARSRQRREARLMRNRGA
jgi:hypothetical protein